MKNSILLFSVLLFPAICMSQTITADEIMRKAKNGDNVRYENVTVKGTVDLTPYPEEGDRVSPKSWFSNDNVIDDVIRGSITFVNCTFEDEFLAYYHDKWSEYTFVAHFDQPVVFKNCTFKRDAAFKYSEFDDHVDFSGSKFERDANFKYAEFQRTSTFKGSNYLEDANFKYAEFEDMVDFSDTYFEEEANFKYAEMDNGVRFTNAEFDGLWNLKYAEMDREVDLEGIKVNDDLDTKYTKVRGRSFNRYLLSGNK